MQPTDKALGMFYDFVKGHEKEAFAILRSTQAAVIPAVAPLLKGVLGDVKLEDPIPNNKPNNQKAEAAFEKQAGTGYIEDQETAACAAIKVGIADLKWGGCGIIATYNLLKAMGKKTSIVDLIAHYEKDSIMVKGEFGTDPYMIEKYFQSKGFKTTQLKSTDTSKVNYVITTFWNDKDNIKDSAHTIALTRESDGKLHSHNNYDKQTFDTMKDFYDKHPKVKPIMVMSVSK